MDSSKPHPFSFHPATSWTTLATTTTSQTYTNNHNHQTSTSQTTSETQPYREPHQYTYVEKRTAPNPDAQPKHKSRLSKFLSKFESSAVRQANAARESKQLEAERTGVHKLAVSGTPAGAAQSTAVFL